MNIPKIELTPEVDDKEENYLSFLEALTDVEDLYDNVTEENDSKKYNLKLSLKDKGSYTDLEDFEASDNETDVKLIKHRHPISLKNLDLESGSVLETFKTQVRKPNGQKKLKTQESVVQQDNPSSSLLEAMQEEDGKTDIEIEETDNEYETHDDIVEPAFVLDNLYKNYEVIESERAENNVATPVVENCYEEEENNELLKTMSYLSNLSLASNFSNATDVEIVNTDSDGEVHPKKLKNKKKRSARKQLKVIATDEEDLDLSEVESKQSHKRSKRNLKVRSKSMPFESDNEYSDNPNFPICKNVITKKQKSLLLPEVERDILTDVEDFEQDNPIPVNDIVVDEEAFENKLREIASSYSNIAECSNVTKNQLLYVAEAVGEHINDENDTDVDCYQSESEVAAPESNNFEECLNVSFYSPQKNVNKTVKFDVKVKKNNLQLPASNQNELTDLENIDSSSENDEIPVAIVNNECVTTDEEDIESKEIVVKSDFPDIILPRATRNLILLTESKSNQPSIKILPLDEDYELGITQVKEVATDEEHFSDENYEIDASFEPIPDLTLYATDGGSIDISDKLKVDKLHDKIDIKTDTEDLFVEKSPKKRKPPKFKYFKKACAPQKKLLVVEQNEALSLTDTEDIYLSDSSKTNTKLSVPVDDTDKQATDVEYIPSSDSDDDAETRSLSCTPQHMREMSGEVILNREGGGPVSANDRLMSKLKLPLRNKVIASPVYTDTEDMNASTDDEIISRSAPHDGNLIGSGLDQVFSSNVHVQSLNRFNCDSAADVMYLKGGGYVEVDTEIDEIITDEKNYKENDLNKNEQSVYIDFEQDFVSFGVNLKQGLANSLILYF